MEQAGVGKGQIFLDTQRISSRTAQVTQRFYQAVKRDAPVLQGDAGPWEETGASTHGTVVHDEGRFKMWYFARGSGHPMDSGWIGYAESTDGIRWEKPELGIVEIDGSRKNNVVALRRYGAAFAVDPTARDPERRYKCLGWIRHPQLNTQWGTSYPRAGYYSARSPDGLHWTDDPNGPRIDIPQDEGRMAWDGYRGRYIASVKQAHNYGFHRRRSVTISTSADAEHWSEPRLVLVADELDDLHAQTRGFEAADYYGLCFYPREDLIVGFLWIHQMWPPFHPTRTSGMFSRIHVQLAYSYDGYLWQHPPGRPALIDVGERGSWDQGSVYTCSAPVEVGDEVWIYYAGARMMHGYMLDVNDWTRYRTDLRVPEDMHDRSAIGLATIKKDRFASMSCDRDGSFVVQHGTLGGTRLVVNARSTVGYVAVQVERPDGSPVPGYDLTACQRFTGDSIAAPISWNGRTLADLPPDQDFALRFALSDADLYGYRVLA